MHSFHLPHPRARELWQSDALSLVQDAVLRFPSGPLQGRVVALLDGALLICADEPTFRRALGWDEDREGPHGGWITVDATLGSAVLVELYPDDEWGEPLHIDDPEVAAAAAVDAFMTAWDAMDAHMDFRSSTVHVDGPDGGFPVEVHSDEVQPDSRIARAWLDGDGDALACALRDALAGLVDLGTTEPLKDLARGMALWDAGQWLERGRIDHPRLAVADWTPGQETAEQAVVEAARAWERASAQPCAVEGATVVEHPDGRRDLRVLVVDLERARHPDAYLPLGARWRQAFVDVEVPPYTRDKDEDSATVTDRVARVTWLYRSLARLQPEDPELPALVSNVAYDLEVAGFPALGQATVDDLFEYLEDVWAHQHWQHPDPPDKVLDALIFLYERQHQAGLCDAEALQQARALNDLRDQLVRYVSEAATFAEMGDTLSSGTLSPDYPATLDERLRDRARLRAEIKALHKEQIRGVEQEKKVEQRRRKKKLAKKTKKKTRKKKKKKRR